jgi:undecaprenyl-diphosphatase
MTLLQAILLGTLQGLTEFLPVSSSGHLVLLQHFLGIQEPTLLFDILVHVATLFAVVAIYHRDVWKLVAACWPLPMPRSAPDPPTDAELANTRRLGYLVLLANVPTALIGLSFASTLERLFMKPWTVGAALIATGLALWSLRYIRAPRVEGSSLYVWQALVVGVVQGLALIPGISRSGSTITAALWCGLDREAAARFSFLMAIPAITGAVLLKYDTLSFLSGGQVWVVLAGMLSALVVGYVALRVLLYFVLRGTFWHFALYCWLLGTVAIMTAL